MIRSLESNCDDLELSIVMVKTTGKSSGESEIVFRTEKIPLVIIRKNFFNGHKLRCIQ